MQGFRLTGLLTGLLPLVAFCILKQSYATFWGSNEVALHFFSLAPHSDRHPISASLHCQLSGRPTRTAVHTSINILTVSSRFVIAYDSCQHCISAVALTYVSSHLLLSICCYVVRGYVAPSCMASLVPSYTITRMMHVRPYTALTQMHALDSMHALYCIILYYRRCACMLIA